MAWHIVEKLIEQVAQHSTLIGKFWTTFFFVLRFLIVVSIADSVFDDEEELDHFTCNTLTPGCENVCYNEFSPISLIRLWALQVLAVSIPSIVFIVYTAHKLTKVEQARQLKKKDEQQKRQKIEEAKKLQQEARQISWRTMTGVDPPEYNHVRVNGEDPVFEPVAEKSHNDKEKEEKKKDEEKKEVIATKLDKDTPSVLFLAYVAQIIFRLLVEIFFLVVQMNTYVYKFYVPELFKCSRWPCPNVVDCFISRPKEKTVIIWVMFGTCVIMIAVNVIELYHIGASKIITAWKNRNEDITKQYKVAPNSMPHFGNGQTGHARYRGGYPQAVGIRVGYARSSISGGGIHGDEYI